MGLAGPGGGDVATAVALVAEERPSVGLLPSFRPSHAAVPDPVLHCVLETLSAQLDSGNRAGPF